MDGETQSMFLTSDEHSSREYRQATAVNLFGAAFRLFDYVLITDIAQTDGLPPQWIGQITMPNFNVSPVGGPLDPTILHAINLKRANPKVQLAETTEVWQITLLGEYQSARLTTLRRRPKPGATVARLDQALTVDILKITPFLETAPNAIGYLTNVESVPLCVERNTFVHHILVSGGTGSGKSNTSANLIKQARNLGFFVFLYDAKPDYRRMKKPNSDPRVKHLWPEFAKYKIQPEGAASYVIQIGIYDGPKAAGYYDKYHEVIGFKASDFDPYALAELFVDEKAKIEQYEELAAVCAYLKYGDDGDEVKHREYSLQDIIEEVQERKAAYLESNKKADKSDQPVESSGKPMMHSATADAILRKLKRAKMPWLDAVGKPLYTRNGEQNAFTKPKIVKAFSVAEMIRRAGEKEVGAGIVHIDCSEDSGIDARAYALFLTRFLSENQKYQVANRKKTGGIVEFVDEAHRLFTNSTRYNDMLARMFSRTMVEGRSVGHGVILSLQNSSQVPALMLNNINTHIVMKQNNKEVAKSATQTMGEDFAEQSLTLGTGEALCKMFESPVVVIAKMAPSPYELERTDNMEQGL